MESNTLTHEHVLAASKQNSERRLLTRFSALSLAVSLGAVGLQGQASHSPSITLTPNAIMGQGLTASGTTTVTKEEIKGLERARQEAFRRRDLDFIDQQTADGYTTINASGALSSKPDMMRSLRAGTIVVKSFELEDLDARIYGDVAVLTGIYRDESSVNGRERQVHVRFTRVFVKGREGWRAVAYQQTPIG